jgi:hypothetical protein
MNLNGRTKLVALLALSVVALITFLPSWVIASVTTRNIKVKQGEANAYIENVTVYERVFVSVPPEDNALEASVIVQLERVFHGPFEGNKKIERIATWVVKKGYPLWIKQIPKDGDIQVRIVNRDCWLEVGVYMALMDPPKKK